MATATRDLIHDTHSTHMASLGGTSRVGVPMDVGDSIRLSDLEYRTLNAGLDTLYARLRSVPDPLGFHFHGTEYTFLAEACAKVSKSGGEQTFDLVWTPADNPRQHIRCTYKLFKKRGGDPTLSFMGNPTTLVRGNNVGPVWVPGESIRRREPLVLYQLGFLLLECLLPRFSWSALTRRRIGAGEIAISNTQWAAGVPSGEKQLDLALLTSLYCARLGSAEGSSELGEYLGFATSQVYKNPYGALNGVFLTKFKGTNRVLSVNFYDKRDAVNARQQGSTLDAVEEAIVDGTLRLDITAHPEFLLSMIGEARRRLVVLLETYPNAAKQWTLPWGAPGYAFARTRNGVVVPGAGVEDLTARTLVDAQWLLGLQQTPDGWRNAGFSRWLFDRVLERELHLFSLLRATPESLHARFESPNPLRANCNALLDYWQAYDANPNAVDFVETAAETFGASTRTVYRWMELIRAELALDITIPYRYWQESGFLTVSYGIDAGDKQALYEALYNGNTLDDREKGAILTRVQRKRAVALRRNRTGLLNNLQLMAQQLPAVPLDLKLLEIA